MTSERQADGCTSVGAKATACSRGRLPTLRV